MKIALIGYGKMGKMIEEAALQKGHSISAKFSPRKQLLTENSLSHADVCIDFSHPDCIFENIKMMASMGKSIVVGTTGWDHHLDEVRELVEKNNIGLIYSANFSIGVTLFFEIVSHAASLIGEFDGYDVGISEEHHRHKADSPSGTALVLSRLIHKIQEKRPPISSLRCGSIPGMHSVCFDSAHDTITLMHQARNRQGFAQGAVSAAEWLLGKRGFFTLEQMVRDL